MVTDPEEMKEATRLRHMILQSPKVPAHKARAFPWCTNEAINMLDGFHQERRGTPDQPLYQQLTFEALSRVVKRLNKNRASGKYGIPNEVLQHLPTTIQRLIHNFFQLCWLTARIPGPWQRSNTNLFVKNDPIYI